MCLGVGVPCFATDETTAEPPPASRECTLLVTLSNEPFANETDIPQIALTFDARIAVRAVVEDAPQGACGLAPGERAVFLIHSPSRTFGGYSFEGRRVFLTLEPADPETGRQWTLVDLESPFVDEVLGPHTFAVLVEDIERSVEWYSRAFALVRGDQSKAADGSWEIVNLLSPDLAVEIIRDNRAIGADRALGFFKVGFAVPDVDLVANRVESATGERPHVVESPAHGIRILQLRDPDGNRIQLSSPLDPPEEP